MVCFDIRLALGAIDRLLRETHFFQISKEFLHLLPHPLQVAGDRKFRRYVGLKRLYESPLQPLVWMRMSDGQATVLQFA